MFVTRNVVSGRANGRQRRSVRSPLAVRGLDAFDGRQRPDASVVHEQRVRLGHVDGAQLEGAERNGRKRRRGREAPIPTARQRSATRSKPIVSPTRIVRGYATGPAPGAT